MNKSIEHKTVAALRALSVDTVQSANSGHPGLPLGVAPAAYALWAKHMIFNPGDPEWINRDRFILSAGHGSALLYSLLHLFGYRVGIDDLKQFRHYNSITPGHPEYGHTEGVETTTGPLGAGLATAVGMAMAQKHQAARYNKPQYEILNHYIYVLAGDGCMMEGIASEASSLAGTLGLDNLIILYDSNNITIEGRTDLAFTENVRARYEAYGFKTFYVADGTDIEAISAALEEARVKDGRPAFIEIKTKIGCCSVREDDASAHGEPLGAENVNLLKEAIGYPSKEPFFVSDEVYGHIKELNAQKITAYIAWQQLYEGYKKAYPELAAQWENERRPVTAYELTADKSLWAFDSKPQATRAVSGLIINRLKEKYCNFIGGAADLGPSTKTLMNNEKSFSRQAYDGRNIHYGVREHAMAAMGNGIVLYGGLHSYVSTFFVFADFLKPMLRLSALMKLPLTYVLTHDSIGLGEDGPTHEPVEQLSMLRATPNTIVFRPADAYETMVGWTVAMTSVESPVVLVLSRQNIPQLPAARPEAFRGGYIIRESKKSLPDAILMASGSEVALILEAAEQLAGEGIDVRAVSMPSMELFAQQDETYRQAVLPDACRKRVAVEAGSSLSWGFLVGLDGACVTLDRFGASGKGEVVFKELGFTAEHVAARVKSLL
jgi:transketolase